MSKGTLNSYINSAKQDRSDQSVSKNSGDKEQAAYAKKQVVKRTFGIVDAKSRLNKEEIEELDELSKGTLDSYMNKAKDRYIKHASSTSTFSPSANQKSVKYAKNILKAKEKGGKFSEEVEGVDEALIGGQKKIDKNHNGKIDGQDFKILRGQKTEAVEPTAVTTDTLAGPVKGGKPNQHSSIKVKLKSEAVNEVMDEPKYSLSIQARQKKADDANKPPFDGPYTKSKGNIKDKSGAIHTPMSRARDLAKNAMKKVKTEMLGKTGTSE